MIISTILDRMHGLGTAILLILFLFFGTGLHAQIAPPRTPAVVEIPKYIFQSDSNYHVLQMRYAWPHILNPEVAYQWREQKIKRVELVFTRYPKSLEKWQFPYNKLLQQRLASLHRLDPSIFQDPKIEWLYILQTDCKNEAQAEDMFHGFVIHLDPMAEEMEAVADIAYQKAELHDSTALKILDRHPEWKDMLVVMDWTGSMYPYGASVLLWHRLNMQRNATIQQFVMFNDGDKRRDHLKRIGKTRGIYPSRSQTIQGVLNTMADCMNGGTGGDEPENDIEALLRGIKWARHEGEVILIADNKSGVRDIALAEEVKVPVRVVLCGVDASFPVRIEYLNLARITGGSVHTIEEDIDRLSDMKDGDSIEIEGKRYMLMDGEFVEEAIILR
ncbi:hypothetical protein [Pontibacter sp. G13]|uniref:hypothetical protein n=1 Tax=Pontibacter sp. G13 TaxID=3074898 RepID=UPI00288AC4E2|nr:hypothetical protein [Pontibacter sp. G13]WNJ16630.1 hypothetical protein RJD25_17330 [Pontibacter sp. G13]